MQWRCEEYLAYLTFGSAARPMFVELFGPLIGLEQEWRAQGATTDELDLTAFDWDWVPVIFCGGHTSARGPEPVLIEDTATHRIERDFLGRTLKLWKATATIPLPLTFPVKTMDDWRRLKPHFEYPGDRVDRDALARAEQARRAGHLVTANMPGAFDMVRELMGEELGCLAYYDQPELLADMVGTFSDTAFRVLEEVTQVVTIDQLSVHEDFAGRSGPLVGPQQIRDYFQPYYRRVWGMLAERGARIFQVDTDGNINSVIEALLDCGVTCLYPMEPAAGMDIVALRRQYGRRLAMLGGIDKHVLRQDQAAIRRELEYKLQPALRNGGTVFGLDHRIPNGTPLANYRYYVDTGRELLGLPPRTPERKGWARMSF